MLEFLNCHFAHILGNRADKSWEPSLHASTAIATAYPQIAGIGVSADDTMPAGEIQIRSDDGEVKASYSGVSI